MNRRITKSLAALVLTAAGSGFVIGFRTSDVSVGTTAIAQTTGTTSTGTAAASASATPATATGTRTSSGGSAATGTSTSSGSSTSTAATYADGTWTGSAVSEPWGTFQVQAVVSGGQITDVVVVAAPSDGHSSSINSQAVPILTQSVLAAQSAQVDMVGGATWTSRSYLTSLQSALDDAAASASANG